MFLIVGLGNPGRIYEETRHNLGFIVVETLAEAWGVKLKQGRGAFRIAEHTIESRRVILAEPLNYMNRSGIAVGLLVNKRSVDLSRLLVVCDDLNLPLGRIRLKRRGSDGGHKGLASIIEVLNSREFPRLRMGIGQDPRQETSEYVLSRFRSGERTIVKDMVERSCRAVIDFISTGIDVSMNTYNG